MASNGQSLLRYGVIVGPLYLALGVGQGLLREGFDFARHPLSVLANGPGGWVQTANFIVCGAMVIAAAVGLSRALAPKPGIFPWFLGAFGASMIAAAIFPADPIDGFPPGTPLGMPTAITTRGLLHFVAGALGFVSLAVACFTATRAMSRRNARGLARRSLLSGLAVFLGFFGGAALGPAGVIGIWISVVVGWTWLAVISLKLPGAISSS